MDTAHTTTLGPRGSTYHWHRASDGRTILGVEPGLEDCRDALRLLRASATPDTARASIAYYEAQLAKLEAGNGPR